MKKVCVLFLLMFLSPVFASGINANSASAPCTNTTLETYSGNTNLAADWAPNEINLRWYNGDQKLTVQSSAQSCTYDGTLTVPSTQPTRTGYTFAGWEVKYTIPAGYTELEYIQSTGTQWIDTNYFPNNNTGVKTKIQFDSIDQSYGSCFGGADVGNTGFECFHWSNSSIYCAYGSDLSNVTQNVYLNDIWEIDWNKNVMNYKINGGDILRYVFSAQTFSEQTQLRLFVLSRGGKVQARSQIKIYYFKLYDNNVLIYDFIPVKRNSDNEIGMYDTVTRTFFANAGTGTFVAGPVVQ